MIWIRAAVAVALTLEVAAHAHGQVSEGGAKIGVFSDQTAGGVATSGPISVALSGQGRSDDWNT